MLLAGARRGASMFVIASATPCMGFMVPGASIAGVRVGRGLHSGARRPAMGPMMMTPRGPVRKEGERPLSGVPPQLGALAAAVTAATTALPNQASAAAASVAEVAQASAASSASDQVSVAAGGCLKASAKVADADCKGGGCRRTTDHRAALFVYCD